MATLARCRLAHLSRDFVASNAPRTSSLRIAFRPSVATRPSLITRASAIAQFHSSRCSREEERVTKFADLAGKDLVHPHIVQTITQRMKMSEMTPVQSLTINEALKSVDVYVSCSLLTRTVTDPAKTGPGEDRHWQDARLPDPHHPEHDQGRSKPRLGQATD